MSIFTRYLYLKDEVCIALLASLLNKDKDQALFWAYELHYSGFTDDLLDLLWKTYFEFYAVLNPTLAVYLHTKQKDKTIPSTILISIIINNLIIRKYNTDIFIMREIASNFEAEDILPPLAICFTEHNYEAIAHYVVETEDATEIIKVSNAYFQEYNINKSKLFKTLNQNKHNKIILLARIMHCYMLLDKKTAIGKSLYVIVEPEELAVYDTIHNIESPRRVLPMALRYSVDLFNMLYLFKKQRDPAIMNHYYYDWLFYASFSPIWLERIEKYKGVIDHETKKIIFTDEDNEETFYNHYNYEPDEQSKTVQEKNIPQIQLGDWSTFFEKYKGYNLYNPDQEYLDNL